MLKNLKETVSNRNRRRKYDSLKALLNENDLIIDIGVDPSIGGNTNYLEKFYDIPNSLTCLGLKANFSDFKQLFPAFKLVEFDGFNFPDFSLKFDWAFCNAVIEHVGNRPLQLKWLKEIRKCTHKLFITTPNKWLPFETHSTTFFFHYLPDRYRDFFYKCIGKEWLTKNYMWLLSEKQFELLLNEAGFTNIRIVKNKFLFFTIDFVAICE